MLIPRGTRIHLAREHADFRKSIDGLSGVVRIVLEDDPSSGHLFIFHNRRRTALKILWWDHGGYCLLYKRLAKGRFRLPFFPDDARRVRISPADLTSLLEGIDLRWARRLERWNPPEIA
ncbi:MAG: IS66 family insertion sequence element accessory protein TnpB [Myxococcota bacterium]